MLRHIMSVSLAIAACATFIPTKVNAATLTVIPVGEVKKNSTESIDFIFAFTPNLSSPNITKFLSLDYKYDGTELSLSEKTSERPQFIAEVGTQVINTTTIARLTFDVIGPIKDGKADLYDAQVYYDDGGVLDVTPIASGADVVPVPEPLTIFGTATALGCGVLFKRKSSKKTVS